MVRIISIYNIYGADIDPTYFNSNLEFLKSQGAFKNKIPFIVEFDQLDTSPENFEAFKGSSFDIVIDDLHSKDLYYELSQCIF